MLLLPTCHNVCLLPAGAITTRGLPERRAQWVLRDVLGIQFCPETVAHPNLACLLFSRLPFGLALKVVFFNFFERRIFDRKEVTE
jgi:hypothetical protein